MPCVSAAIQGRRRVSAVGSRDAPIGFRFPVGTMAACAVLAINLPAAPDLLGAKLAGSEILWLFRRNRSSVG